MLIGELDVCWEASPPLSMNSQLCHLNRIALMLH